MLIKYSICENKVVKSDSADSPILLYINPSAEEKAYLLNTLGLDEHNLGSALDPDELARLEFVGDHLTAILKRPKNYSSEDKLLFKVVSMGIFLFAQRLIIVTADDSPVFESKHFISVSSLTDVMLKLFSSIISHFLGHLKTINMISDELEQKINASMENRYLLNMFTLEKSLVYYLNSTNSNLAVLEKLRANAERMKLVAHHVEFCDDMIIENRQCMKQAEIYSNIIASLMDARASIVNNNLNILIKRLTIINIVFMPLNLLAGMGGMSEFSMMTGSTRATWYIPYVGFTLAMVLIGLVVYRIMIRVGMEGRGHGLMRWRKKL